MQPSTPVKTFLLSAIFLLTGIAVALPGAVLPAVLQQWGLTDRRGGLLLLLMWSGSTSGILFSRGNLEWSVIRGTLLTAAALFGLATIGRPAALPLFALYGVGLGITMSSTSVLRSRQVESSRRTREMNRMNMLWAIGACACPVIALRAVHTMHASAVFASIGFAFFLGFAGLALTQLSPANGPVFRRDREPSGSVHVPLRLCLFAALAVGVEASLGGWLTTFAGRTTHAAGLAVSVNSAFWAGLLISRAIHSSARLRWLHVGPGLPIHTVSAVVATGWLLTEPQGALLLFAALLAGLGLGPLYPLSLGMALPKYKPVAIFMMAGAGSAVFPWLTGTASTRFGSLRTGLVVPCIAAVALLVTGFWVDQEPETLPTGTIPLSE